MRLWDPKGPHKCGDVIGENLGRIGTFRFGAFASPSEVQRDARKVLGVFGHLECITGVIGG